MEKEDRTSKEVGQDILTDSRKMTIINIALLTLTGTDFKPKIGKMKAWGENEVEQAFTKEVFDAIKECSRGTKIDAEFKRQLKNTLYDRFNISKEMQSEAQAKAQKTAKQTSDYIKQQREKWAEQDREVAQKISEYREATQKIGGQGSKTVDITSRLANNSIDAERVEGLAEDEIKGHNTIDIFQEQRTRNEYKSNLYKPHLIATSNKTKQERPLIKLNKRKPEDIVDYEYEYAGTQYMIRRTGELLYKTFVGVEDSISEYEITMRREDKVLTVRKFGYISVPTMEYESYRTEVFTTLLGKNNMEDPELHSYIGSLEEVKGPTREIQPYKIEHSAEEYTAVMILEELERQQARNERLRGNKVSGEDKVR